MKILPIQEIYIDDQAAQYSIDASYDDILNSQKNYLADDFFIRALDKYMSSIYGSRNPKEANQFSDDLRAFIDLHADTEARQALVNDLGASVAINFGKSKYNPTDVTTDRATNTKSPTSTVKTDKTDKENLVTTDPANFKDPDDPVVEVDGWTVERLKSELKKYGYKETDYNLEDLARFAQEHPEIVNNLSSNGKTGADFQGALVEFTLPTGQVIKVQMGGDLGFDNRDDKIISVSSATTAKTAKDALAKVAPTLKDDPELSAVVEDPENFSTKLATSLVDYLKETNA